MLYPIVGNIQSHEGFPLLRSRGIALVLSERIEEALAMESLILDMTRIEPENLEV